MRDAIFRFDHGDVTVNGLNGGRSGLLGGHGDTTTMTLERDGLFDMSVHKILVEADLQPETIFQCLLTIPGTSFTAKADSMYLKGQGNIRN